MKRWFRLTRNLAIVLGTASFVIWIAAVWTQSDQLGLTGLIVFVVALLSWGFAAWMWDVRRKFDVWDFDE